MNTFWITRYKATGKRVHENQAVGPKLYVSEKMARARNRGWKETNEEQDKRLEFIRVRLVEVSDEG